MKLIVINTVDGPDYEVTCDSVTTNFNPLSGMYIFTFRDATLARCVSRDGGVIVMPDNINMMELAIAGFMAFDA